MTQSHSYYGSMTPIVPVRGVSILILEDYLKRTIDACAEEARASLAKEIKMLRNSINNTLLKVEDAFLSHAEQIEFLKKKVDSMIKENMLMMTKFTTQPEPVKKFPKVEKL